VAAEPSELMTLDGRVFRRLVGHSDVLKRLFRATGTQYKTEEEMERLRERLDPRLSTLTAADIMQRDLACLRPDMTIADALAVIRSRRHSSYPVVGADGCCAGALFREDLFHILKSSSTPMDTPLAKLDLRLMPAAADTCPAAELLDLMLTRGSHKVMIHDAQGKLRGIVTLLDLIPDARKPDSATPAA
jgi:CBS domain-containing membrane protein